MNAFSHEDLKRGIELAKAAGAGETLLERLRDALRITSRLGIAGFNESHEAIEVKVKREASDTKESS